MQEVNGSDSEEEERDIDEDSDVGDCDSVTAEHIKDDDIGALVDLVDKERAAKGYDPFLWNMDSVLQFVPKKVDGSW